MSFLPFVTIVLVAAGLLALFLPSKQVLLIGIAAAAGIFSEILVDWWAPGEKYQIRYLLTALPSLSALEAILGYLWPWQAWQWGLVPFLAAAIWNVARPYATVKWGNLGPIPYLFTFYAATWAAIPAIIASELAAYARRRRSRNNQ